jgi:hypothetical protein
LEVLKGRAAQTVKGINYSFFWKMQERETKKNKESIKQNKKRE